MPVGVRQFTDGNGAPLVGGWVAYAQVGTGGTVLRNVYADEGETVPLSNPVPLDASGRPYSGGSQCSIWGDGSYEEYVYDANGVLQTSSIIDTQSAAATTAAATGSGERIGSETEESRSVPPSIFRQNQQLGTTLGFPITRGGFATADDHGYAEIAFAEPFQFLGTILTTPFTSPESRHHGHHENPFVVIRKFSAAGFTVHSRPNQDFFWMAAGS